MTTINTSQRNVGIDFLRGLAVLLVILQHVEIRMPLEQTLLANWLPIRLLNAVTQYGYEAVFVFFVISGFLITNLSLQRWDSLNRIDIKSFYARRFARIMPCLLLLVTILSVLHIAGATYYTINKPDQSLDGAIFSALTMHLNWYEGHTGYLPAGWGILWSLSIEEAFYLGFPILCLLLTSRRLLIAVLIILALSLPITRAALEGNEIWKEKAYLPGMAAIATGILSALLAQNSLTWRPLLLRRIKQLLLVIGSAGLCSILFYEDVLWKILRNGTMLILTGSSACLILAFYWHGLSNPQQRPLRGIAWLCTMGRQSYEIYLTHMFIVFGIVALVTKLNTAKTYNFLWYVPAALLSWLLGTLLERWYSRPCDQHLRHRLIRSK